MHEFSIAESLVKAAKEEYEKIEKPCGSLQKVHVVIGLMHSIVVDNLQMAYEMLTKDTDFSQSSLELEFKQITADCKSCGSKVVIEMPLFRCSNCESFELDITGGKEMYLSKLEIDGEK